MNKPQYLITTLCVVILLVVASTAGCTSSTTSSSSSGQASPSEQASATTYKLQIPHYPLRNQSDNVSISVTYYRSPSSVGPYNSTPILKTDKFVEYNVTTKDVNERNYNVSPGDFMITDSNGEVNYFTGYGETFNSSTMQPGQTISGHLVYEIPQNATPKTITYTHMHLPTASFEGTVDQRTFDASPR